MPSDKRQITLEYPISSTVASLFAKLSTEGGLRSWFADDVTQQEKFFIFSWNKTPQEAEVLEVKNNELIRFRWAEDNGEEHYFEFRIESSELTGELSLVVVDFVENADYDDALSLWDNNIRNLRRSLGAVS